MAIYFDPESCKSYEEMTAEEREIYLQYLEKDPDCINYFVANMEATTEEIQATARVLRRLKKQVDAIGLNEWEGTTPQELLNLFERRAMKNSKEMPDIPIPTNF